MRDGSDAFGGEARKAREGFVMKEILLVRGLMNPEHSDIHWFGRDNLLSNLGPCGS